MVPENSEINVHIGGIIGHSQGGMVSGLNKVIELNTSKLIVFGVGFTAKEEVDNDKMKVANKMTDTPFYYFQGGMNPNKMGFMGRTIVKMVTKKTPQYEDNTNRKEIEELVSLVKDKYCE